MARTKIDPSLLNVVNNYNAAGYLKGSIVQTVTTSISGSTSGTSTTYTTGATATFTPLVNTHKVRITAIGCMEGANPSVNNVDVTIFNGATDLSPNGTVSGICSVGDGGVTVQIGVPFTMVVIDSPATTSTITYTIKIRNCNSTSSTWTIGKLPGNGSNGHSYFIFEEIAA